MSQRPAKGILLMSQAAAAEGMSTSAVTTGTASTGGTGSWGMPKWR